MSISALKEAKKLMRKEISGKIKCLSDNEKLTQSSIVQRKLLCHEAWLKSRRVSIYLSTADEVETMELLRQGFEGDKRMFIPRYSKKSMEMVEIRSMEDYSTLPTTPWHIKQPSLNDTTRQIIDLQNGGLDVMVVPGLAFTTQGHRLGRGGGYYDTYLSNYKSQFGILPFLIAPTFKQQMVDSIPCTELDVKVDVVLFGGD